MPVKQKEAVKEQACDFFERLLGGGAFARIGRGFREPAGRHGHSRTRGHRNCGGEAAEQMGFGRERPAQRPGVARRTSGKVYDLEAPDKFDGMSGWAGKIPVVVVNRRFPADRNASRPA